MFSKALLLLPQGKFKLVVLRTAMPPPHQIHLYFPMQASSLSSSSSNSIPLTPPKPVDKNNNCIKEILPPTLAAAQTAQIDTIISSSLSQEEEAEETRRAQARKRFGISSVTSPISATSVLVSSSTKETGKDATSQDTDKDEKNKESDASALPNEEVLQGYKEYLEWYVDQGYKGWKT